MRKLSKKFNILLTYFKKNFYKESTYRQDTEKYVSSATTQLDNLLRYPGIRNILCKRTDNLNFDSALANGNLHYYAHDVETLEPQHIQLLDYFSYYQCNMLY